jgi:hypothetical protein
MTVTGRLVRKVDQPFIGDHMASKTRKMAPPRNLLHWFMDAFRAEMPDELHSSGVWREYVTEDGRHTGGGSLLGTPRYDDTFRRFIEDRPGSTELAEYDGHRDLNAHYRYPLRAALASLAGRHSCTLTERRETGHLCGESPFMARVLYRTALRDGDYDAACASMGIPVDVRGVYIGQALYRLWSRFETEPRPWSVRTEGVA